MSQTVIVHVSRRFEAPPERIFDAWLDADSMRRWLFATPNGEMIRAEADPKVGGRFLFTDRRGGADVDHVGEYLKIERPKRLVFTFKVPMFSAVETCVAIEITPSGQGCELVLTHTGVFPEYREQTQQGWTGILAGLARALA